MDKVRRTQVARVDVAGAGDTKLYAGKQLGRSSGYATQAQAESDARKLSVKTELESISAGRRRAPAIGVFAKDDDRFVLKEMTFDGQAPSRGSGIEGYFYSAYRFGKRGVDPGSALERSFTVYERAVVIESPELRLVVDGTGSIPQRHD